MAKKMEKKELLLVVIGCVSALSFFLLVQDPFTKKIISVKAFSNLPITITLLRGGHYQKIKTHGFHKEKICFESTSKNFRKLYHSFDFRDHTQTGIPKFKTFLASYEIFCLMQLAFNEKEQKLFFDTFRNHVEKMPSNSIETGSLIQKCIPTLPGGKLDTVFTGFKTKNLDTAKEQKPGFRLTEKISLNYPSFKLIISIFVIVVIVIIFVTLIKKLENAKKLIKINEEKLKFTEYQKSKCNAQRILELSENLQKIEVLEKKNNLQSVKLKSLNEKINRICNKKQLTGECPEALEKLKRGIKKNPKKLLKNLPEYRDFF